jgi:MFS family permease
MKEKIASVRSLFSAVVIVASLGYFVDIYDLILFSVVRISSLRDLGYSQQEIEKFGLLLLNVQMIGMLVGGVFWGVLGDKRGRLSVLFGSIILYSVANILNAFAQDVTQYAVFRFIAGIGLAGELGAGITLVAESLPKEKRGYGTMIISTIGVSGALFAVLIYKVFQDWRVCYIIGGVLGLTLLVLRIGVYESGMFSKLAEKTNIQRGNFFMFFRNKEIFLRYLKCILLGIPCWYLMGILVTLAPEFIKELKIQTNLETKDMAGYAVLFAYTGITIGDFACGTLSQILLSRKKALLIFTLITAIGFSLYFSAEGAGDKYFYALYLLMGFGTGIWAVVVTNAAEQFGTNLRATAATSVPNFIRGSLVLISFLFASLQSSFSKLQSAEIVALVVITVTLIALHFTKETFGKDLNFEE